MNVGNSNSNDKKRWESVHVCPQCAFVIKLFDLDFKAVTTGIIECPRCKWAGAIKIQIAEDNEALE